MIYQENSDFIPLMNRKLDSKKTPGKMMKVATNTNQLERSIGQALLKLALNYVISSLNVIPVPSDASISSPVLSSSTNLPSSSSTDSPELLLR